MVCLTVQKIDLYFKYTDFNSVSTVLVGVFTQNKMVK